MKVYSTLVGRMFMILGVKFAEMAGRDPVTTAAVDGLTVLCTPRGFSAFFVRLSLNSLSVCAITVREEPNLHVNLPASCHRHDYDLMWF